MDKVLKVAKKLKTFTPEDIAIFCEIELEEAEKFLKESDNIKACGNKFEYMESVKTEEISKLLIKILNVKILILQQLRLVLNF